jgi:hypothetical protein
MSRDRAGADEQAVEDSRADEKDELRRQMDESRDAISETVGEIKAVVARQYEEVRERVDSVRVAAGEVLDWREQFDRNPVVWGAGAVSIGILIGLGLARAIEDEEDADRAESLAGRAASELTALAEAVLPTVSAHVKELFGLDLDAYLRETRRPRTLSSGETARPARKKKRGASGPTSGKAPGKRSAKKQGASAKPAAVAAKRAPRKRNAR